MVCLSCLVLHPHFFLWQLDIIVDISYATAECTAADAFDHAGENIVFASGSPFENIDLGMFSFCNTCVV